MDDCYRIALQQEVIISVNFGGKPQPFIGIALDLKTQRKLFVDTVDIKLVNRVSLQLE